MGVGGLSKARLARMHDVMAGHVERGELPGLVTVVSRRGEVHVDVIGMKAVGGSEPMQRDTIFRLASMTKPITAAAAMILVEECTLRLDDPVDPLLPELADRQVLKRIDGPIDDTVPANRPITLRDLLTLRLGFGSVMEPPGRYPIQNAIAEAGLDLVPSSAPSYPPDEWMKRLGSLPLMYQPGDRWLYHTGSDILSVLIARAAGQPFDRFLRERIFEPLGMKDTGFHVQAEKLDRLPPSYVTSPEIGTLMVDDDPRDSLWARPPVFPSGGGGLVATADDYLAFCQMMLNKGRHGHERILSRPSVELMTTDQLTSEQKAQASIFFHGTSGWGFGMAVTTRREDLARVPGRFGWAGILGTSGYCGPTEEMVEILMAQSHLNANLDPPRHFLDFWTSAYQAIDD